MSKAEKIILLVPAVLLAVLLAVLVFRVSEPVEVVVGEFTAPEFDPAAVKGVPAVSHPERYGTLNLTEEIAVSLYSSPVVKDGRAQVYFTSPETNAGWIRLRLYDNKGNVIGETGLVRPGEYVEFVSLTATPKRSAATAKILTYEPDTYYSMGSATAEIVLDIVK